MQGLASADASLPLTFNKLDVKSWYLTDLLLMIFTEAFSTKGEVFLDFQETDCFQFHS